MVKVKLFANFREVVGKKEIEISATTVLDLLIKLSNEYPELKQLIFRDNKISDYVNIVINCEIVQELNTKLNKDDVVAIFPPVSGG
ncbi:MAG TPA: MoaD/ThiS family protein [Archaeoglobus profundus]|nr:MoaD/ThiS family protein [Archaeoglobus profundus]